MIAPLAVLIGPPGSGKSTIASRLADLWGAEARDTDADIVANEGREIGEIFVESGEAAFREIERRAVIDALAHHRGVLALGGGAILDPETQGDLSEYAARGGTVVFLNVGLATAARRVGLSQSRPLLAGSPRRAWSELMESRRATYESLATLTVDTDRTSPREVAAAIDAAVASRAEGPR